MLHYPVLCSVPLYSVTSSRDQLYAANSQSNELLEGASNPTSRTFGGEMKKNSDAPSLSSDSNHRCNFSCAAATAAITPASYDDVYSIMLTFATSRTAAAGCHR